MILLYLILNFIYISSGLDKGFLGCYIERPFVRSYTVPQYYTFEQCINECKLKFYKYSLVKDQGFCFCSNLIGEELSTDLQCREYCYQQSCQNRGNLTDVYTTGNLIAGPPRDLRVTNVTSNSVRLTWKEPESFTEILGYKLRAEILHSYSSFSPMSPEWTYSNNTFQTELILQPATKYNITLNAVSQNVDGAQVYTIVETDVGDPDNLPDPPIIIKRAGSKMEVKLSPVTNNNGPVTSYLVVVVKMNSGQIFQEDYLKSYQDAHRDGLTYYIAAELSPRDIGRTFIVGDGRRYGRYYNEPLAPENNYDVLLGVVSELKGKRKIVYSEPRTVRMVEPAEYEADENSPVLVIGLSIAIGLLSFMLVAGIIGFIILKSRVTHRRQRLSDNQELTLQGPMIEVENNGYIPEEEPSKSKHYKNLKQKLKAINFNQLKIEPTHLIGIGRFGRVNSGVYDVEPVAVYSISDKKLNPDDKKSMLRELDALIRTGVHDNIIKLIGTCETPQQVLVVLESVSTNLKDFLLGNRDFLPGRFSNLSETQAFDFALQIAQGMTHLGQNRIVHKQLCARNILVAGNTVKISGYGLAQFYRNNKFPDYTRWSALEVLKGQNPTSKSDVWSFACLFWEMCVLGGTPYGNVPNNEIPERVMKGLRLPQMKYFSDDLYQIMLYCWQIDMDERPTFDSLIESLRQLKESSLIPHLSFNMYSSFQYEQFYPDMEIAVRPVF